MKNRTYWILGLLIIIIIGCLYLGNQVKSIYGGDAGDLVSAIITSGIPHPPGYPLYTVLGILLRRILPFGTEAWKAGFLSSIPSIVALFLLFDLLCLLTKKPFISFISVMVLGLTYPIWLYSVVVEVFSLNNLFIIILLSLSVRFYQTKNTKYLYLSGFTAGLSLTHHHIVVFLYPTIAFMLFLRKKHIRWKSVVFSVFYFLLGLVPYLYVFIAGSNNISLNWLGKPTLSNFVALITRETYGTFTAGPFIAHNPVLRLYDIWGFLNFAYKDFRLAGIILIILGIYHFFKKEREVFIAVTIGLLSYMFFLFYASFPLSSDFMVATFERFIQPLYIILTIYLVFGLSLFLHIMKKILSKLIENKKQSLMIPAVLALLVIYPLGLFFLNYPKISILSNDFTAEFLARDIFQSVPKNSIILIAVDTPLFNSQYLYNAEKQKWQDVYLIHFAKLMNYKYQYQFPVLYPDIKYSFDEDSIKKQFESFLSRNYENHAIFTIKTYPLENGKWVPWGLLYRYYKTEDVPEKEDIFEANNDLWDIYQNPKEGSLSKYDNLMLSDVVRIYTVAHLKFGIWTAENGFTDEAKHHLSKAQEYMPEILDSYKYLAQVYTQIGECELSQNELEKSLEIDPENPETYLLMSINWGLCFEDKDKAKMFFDIYQEKLQEKETELNSL